MLSLSKAAHADNDDEEEDEALCILLLLLLRRRRRNYHHDLGSGKRVSIGSIGVIIYQFLWCV